MRELYKLTYEDGIAYDVNCTDRYYDNCEIEIVDVNNDEELENAIRYYENIIGDSDELCDVVMREKYTYAWLWPDEIEKMPNDWMILNY